MEIGYNSYSCGIPPELEYLDIAGANLSGVMPQGHLLVALLLYWSFVDGSAFVLVDPASLLLSALVDMC
ncbi:hypothetical protein SUGI_0606220 [Cryptomeria japonica]|nr:hypothetical protein SUGI_0606220 [Cryptomeria japonica]